ncbi:hypothetical protein CMK11_09390 [Candidatus Poribacteria bacterium]|nr:hypothetical protein [Candidatus Poribacteria bacterium]
MAFVTGTDRVASVGGGDLLLWDLETLSLEGAIENVENAYAGSALSPDGRMFASGEVSFDLSRTHSVRVWDVVTQQLLVELPGHQQPVLELAFSADGSLLASAGGPLLLLAAPAREAQIPEGPATVRVWETQTWQEAAAFQPGNSPWEVPHGMQFSPDGQYLTYSYDGSHH